MKDEVKRCPFCGGGAQQVKGEKDYWIINHNKKCWLVSTGLIIEFCVQHITNKGDAEFWNTRPVEDGLEEQLTRARKYTAELKHQLQVDGWNVLCKDLRKGGKIWAHLFGLCGINARWFKGKQ